jgi:molybdenum cofactor biosynthesis protein B
MTEHERRAAAEAPEHIRCALITVSDTRTAATDTSGQAMRAILEQHGHTVVGQQIVRDEIAQITGAIRAAAARCDVIITSGGTGITRRDSTYEAVQQLLAKELPGFGELFRMLSYHEIGAAAMLSRATAGVFDGSIVFCLPGSTNAVRLALERLIVPQMRHLVWELLRQ